MAIHKAVIPAAGLGTRLLPATKAIPKEMVPLADKPAIQYIVEEAVESGVSHLIVITSRTKRAIEDHFDETPELEQMLQRKGDTARLEELRRIERMAQLTVIRQPEPKGLGHAILMAKDLVGAEPFGVLLPDDLVRNDGGRPCLEQLIRVQERHSGIVLAVMRVPRDQVSRYGVVAVEPADPSGGLGPRIHRVRDVVEKPPAAEAPSDLIIIGRYALTSSIFGALERTAPGAGGEIQLTDAIRALRDREPIYAYEFEGERFDIGDPVGFLTTSLTYALRRPDLAPGVTAYIRALRLAKS